MSSLTGRISVIVLAIVVGISIHMAASGPAAAAKAIPAATTDDQLAKEKGKETAVFAGGCFWGVQSVFSHVKGVSSAISGYAGGTVKNPEYEQVSTGTTGHAESVKVTYDPSKITYGQLLRIFFGVAHDPTELNFQGPDHGTQYRSVIFYGNDDQKKIADAYIAQLEAAKVYPGQIVTEVAPLKAFYDAEAYHQDYAEKHPENPYIVYNDAPKVANLKAEFPELYK
jgi:peptide-methionine (S)-S-oxide reductase